MCDTRMCHGLDYLRVKQFDAMRHDEVNNPVCDFSHRPGTESGLKVVRSMVDRRSRPNFSVFWANL